MSAKRRRERRRGKLHRIKWVDVLGYSALLILVGTVAYLTAPSFNFTMQNQPSSGTQAVHAVVIDQLSGVSAGSGLIASIVTMFGQRGIAPDVFLPGDITVSFYAGLAARGYNLIILRVHTGLGNEISPLGLFTNEPYDPNKYVVEQATGLVGAAQASDGSPVVFAVTSKFIRQTMRGDFRNAIIVLGGCYGLRGSDLAQAFVDKGAKVVVGWTGLVNLDHTDKALRLFLEEFIVQGKNIRSAVYETMRVIGADPTYDSVLSYYPPDQGDNTLTFSPTVILDPRLLLLTDAHGIDW